MKPACSKCGATDKGLGQFCDGPLLCSDCQGINRPITDADRAFFDDGEAALDRFARGTVGQAWAEQEREEAFARRRP